MFGESSRVVFGENSLTIHHDVEYTASAFNQFDGVTGLLFDRGRQTGGLGAVVSLTAIGDRNVHRIVSFQIGVFRNSPLCKDGRVLPASQRGNLLHCDAGELPPDSLPPGNGIESAAGRSKWRVRERQLSEVAFPPSHSTNIHNS